MWLLGLCILVFGSDLKKFWANYLCRNVGFKVFAGSEGAWLSWLQLLHVPGLVLTLRLGYLNPCRQYSWGACACVRRAEEINMLKILRCLQSDALPRSPLLPTASFLSSGGGLRHNYRIIGHSHTLRASCPPSASRTRSSNVDDAATWVGARVVSLEPVTLRGHDINIQNWVHGAIFPMPLRHTSSTSQHRQTKLRPKLPLRALSKSGAPRTYVYAVREVCMYVCMYICLHGYMPVCN